MEETTKPKPRKKYKYPRTRWKNNNTRKKASYKPNYKGPLEKQIVNLEEIPTHKWPEILKYLIELWRERARISDDPSSLNRSSRRWLKYASFWNSNDLRIAIAKYDEYNGKTH